MEIDHIPLSIRPYLLEIAERLWTGHASVMVGAGFSKNAINKDDRQKGMPNWTELGDIFYQKIHGQPPGNHANYLNALKLADEVQAAFGRSVLDQMLKQHIPDKDFEPSDTHVKLLEMPWSDVFTTNYDTLLERSCENVISRRYDVVINQNDIIYSNQPRIIKLHGSFPSERPLIITEEDYRGYPKRFAPFVNTVQQSLLENTLCLIGFSGDDPNFLQWIGWINDNIGKENSPKIYLLGVLKLSEAQKKLLATKNIVPVDLGALPGANGAHKKAMDIFLEFLLNQRRSRENLEWPLNQKYYRPSEEDIHSIVTNWKTSRLAYPNWIICPQENRERLWEYTSYTSVNEWILHDKNAPVALDFIYEFNWRFEKSLFPLYNDQVPTFENILSDYNPFPNELISTATHHPGNPSDKLDWQDIKSKWLHLTLALLRFYREEGFKDKWQINFQTLELLKGYLSPEQFAWFYYERVLMAIFDSDINLAKSTIHEWPANEYEPFWDAKRASLLAELGYLEESQKLLENCLTTVRKRLNLNPIHNDYKWVSQEAFLMFLLQLIRHNVRNFKKIYTKDEQFLDFDERWNDLLQFKCSPWQEKKHFDVVLQHKYTPKISKNIKELFEIGVTTTTFSLGGSDIELIVAYNFLRYIEEIGIPLSLRFMNVDDKTVRGALERLEPYSPHWTYAIFKRSRDTDLAEIIFSRLGLAKLDVTAIDLLINEYLKKYQLITFEDDKSILASSFVKKVPIALSRLCIKCSDTARMDIFKFYVEALNTTIGLDGMAKLWKNLISSSDDKIKTEIIPLLLESPVINGTSVRAQLEFPEPFNSLKVKLVKSLFIPKSTINDLLKKASDFENLRQRALTRLIFLNEHKLLSLKEVNKLFEIVWQKVDDNGFPAQSDYYYHVFINWPHPTNIDVLGTYKRFILKNTFAIQSEKTSGVSMGGGHDRYAEELWHGSASVNHPERTKWTEEELGFILEKCLTWWNSDKHFLIEERYKDESFGSSIYNEFMARFKLLVNIICRVYGFHRKVIKNTLLLSKITNLIVDIEKTGIPVLKAKIAFADLLKYDENNFISEIETNVIDGNQLEKTEALEAAALSLFYFKKHIRPEYTSKILDAVILPLKWRNIELFSDCLSIIDNILEHMPECYLYVKPVILASLKYLKKFTDITAKNNGDGDIPKLLLLRKRALQLANTVFTIEKDDFSPEVLDWRDISENQNEFKDITCNWTF